MYDKKRERAWTNKSINLFGGKTASLDVLHTNGVLDTTVNKEIQATQIIIRKSGLVG